MTSCCQNEPFNSSHIAVTFRAPPHYLPPIISGYFVQRLCEILTPPDAKSPRPVSRRGLNCCDVEHMQVICPMCQLLAAAQMPAGESPPAASLVPTFLGT
jgi:hypothetical protein